MKVRTILVVVSLAVGFVGCSGGGDGGGTGDTVAPTAPTLSAQATSSTTIHLNWWGSTDDRGVAGYRLYRGDAPYHDETGTTWVDVGLTPSTQYCYQVLAYDAAANESSMSAQQCATTLHGTNETLTVTKSGTGSGTVSGTGISCGTDCSESYPFGTSVTLTATAAAGSTFASWIGCTSSSGNTCNVTMSGAAHVTAYFNLTPVTDYALTVTKSGMGSGTVSGTGISCGNDCSESYPSGTSVTLTATAASGSTFVSWTGCTSSSGNTCNVTMSAARTVTATFTGGGGVCTPGQQRCPADLSALDKIEVCNSSGQWNPPTSCGEWKLCAKDACRPICEITTTPAVPTSCFVPYKSAGFSGNGIIDWNDSHMATPTYVTAAAYKDFANSTNADVWSDTTAGSWPYYWSIGYPKARALYVFRLTQFTGGRTVEFEYRAKRSGITTLDTPYGVVGVFVGAEYRKCAEQPPILSFWGTYRCSFKFEFTPTGWNTIAFAITGSGMPDSVDLNYVKLTIR